MARGPAGTPWENSKREADVLEAFIREIWRAAYEAEHIPDSYEEWSAELQAGHERLQELRIRARRTLVPVEKANELIAKGITIGRQRFWQCALFGETRRAARRILREAGYEVDNETA